MSRAALALGPALLVACSASDTPRDHDDRTPDSPAQVVFLTDRGELPISIEVADTPDERARGLMHRDHLDDYAGMLFVFHHEAPRRFWMKNTLIPLDMIFVDSEREVVGIVADAEPMTLTGRGVPAPAKYVVEVRGGFCARYGVNVGTRIDIRGAPTDASR